ncbi:dihydrodipicolinate synthase [Spirochaeta africana DSM 8902]|uniref:4-hydroxy-tetrahydrodipicolinate synthase n=2 Tax=Spirochaeta TaxID=146 RepID=H9UL48_SPIAZ|nr:dihydrodipicolinate synthase [Spirochaeta africana DSM 8902]
MQLRGLYTALVTPFAENGSIDRGSLKRLVDFQIANGVDGLVPVGSTGESPTVSHTENIEVIEEVIRYADGRIPVIAGTGSNSTAEAVRMTKQAAAIGAAASLQVAPYYNRPTQEGLYRHFCTIADETGLPLIIYNIPGRTACNITPETIQRISRNSQVIGIKEAAGSIPQAMEIISQRPKNFGVVAGDDNLTLPLIQLGADGVISVASNLIPGHMQQLVTAALKDQVETARSLHYQLLPLFKALFWETNPIPIKYALASRGIIAHNRLRLPLTELAPELHAAMDELLKSTPVEPLHATAE